jgi:hypothetical protein
VAGLREVCYRGKGSYLAEAVQGWVEDELVRADIRESSDSLSYGGRAVGHALRDSFGDLLAEATVVLADLRACPAEPPNAKQLIATGWRVFLAGLPPSCKGPARRLRSRINGPGSS